MTFYCDVKFENSHSLTERMEFPRCPVVGDELVIIGERRVSRIFQVTKGSIYERLRFQPNP